MNFRKHETTEKDVTQSACYDTSGEGGTRAAVYEESGIVHLTTNGEEKESLVQQHLMEEICAPENMNRAYKRVVSNKGAAGVDGMTVKELHGWLAKHKTVIIGKLLADEYKPSPVRRVEIPKPDGGTRMLGIPTVMDRLIQQAVLQVLTPILDPMFSNASYGFRPGRSAHQALLKAKEYVAEGNWYVVDIDLEKFFDRVNHDMLMARVAKHVKDKRVLRLIRKCLQAGIMHNGVCMEREEGTPQGGPLSPLLANLLLHDLDMELEKRGHKFCRYADDCNIYVGSEKAGNRVMESVSDFIEKKLKLKINRDKSSVSPSSMEEILGLPNIQRSPVHRKEKHRALQE